MKNDHYTRLNKDTLKVIIGWVIASMLPFLTLMYPEMIKITWEHILCDILLFVGFALTILGSWGWIMGPRCNISFIEDKKI